MTDGSTGEDTLGARARARYMEEADRVDPSTRAALAARRRAALARLHPPAARRWVWAAAGGLATAALAAALLLPDGAGALRDASDHPPTAVAAATVDAPGPASGGDKNDVERFGPDVDGPLELANDAAFYAWLASAPAAVSDDDGTAPRFDDDGWTL